MNKRIYDLVKKYENPFLSTIDYSLESNSAIFNIFDDFLHSLKDNKKSVKGCGVEYVTATTSNLIMRSFDIDEQSWNKEGVGFLLRFNKTLYSIRFTKFRDGAEMRYNLTIRTIDGVNYSGRFIYKYLLYCALDASKLKGSYFSMERNKFNWDIKDVETRTFGDIYLPNEIMEDLHLYVDIFKESNRILRYLKVGNPGVGKTEATLVIASELNKLGVTVIKTSICDKLHDKVELANVLAPSIIVFDDIDLSLGDRNKGAYSTLLGDFLDVLDGTDKLADNVGVIATTNAAHLLDLAAQRPGRFDKTLLFDDITKGNIKDIILKSLKSNFKITKGNIVTVYSDKRIVNKFHDSGVSGSHIFNAIKMLKLRYDTLKIKDVSVDRIITSIESELKVIEKIRKVTYLKEKYDRNKGSIGFSTNEDESLDESKELSAEDVGRVIRRARKNTPLR